MVSLNKADSMAKPGEKPVRKVSQRIYALIAMILIYILFAIFGRNFLTFGTLVNILDASYYIGFLAIGVTFVIITGGIDLSIGTVALCSAMIGGVAWSKWGLPFTAGLVLIVVSGALFGLMNGLFVSRLKLPPFIATLGTMMISLGISSIVSKVQTVNFPARTSEAGWFKSVFSKVQVSGGTMIPTGAIFLAVTLLISFVILNKTKIGRYTFAIGSNEEAVRLSGVNVVFWKTIPYIISGLCAGLSGIVYAATYTTVVPGAGQGFELDAIAGVVIGGTSLSGGVGSVFGTLIGVMIMSILRIGLPSMDLQPHYQKLFTGIVVIIAVLMDISQQKKR
jgi:ribose transport system permease protein